MVEYIEIFCDVMLCMVVEYNVNIIIGFMLFVEDDKIYNVSYLCYCSGKIDE